MSPVEKEQLRGMEGWVFVDVFSWFQFFVARFFRFSKFHHFNLVELVQRDQLMSIVDRWNCISERNDGLIAVVIGKSFRQEFHHDSKVSQR